MSICTPPARDSSYLRSSLLICVHLWCSSLLCATEKETGFLSAIRILTVTPAKAGVHIPEASVYGPRLSPG
ncbi:MAG: hypothetical protein ACREE7_07985, partial [Dongiaceae bacterium]